MPILEIQLKCHSYKSRYSRMKFHERIVSSFMIVGIHVLSTPASPLRQASGSTVLPLPMNRKYHRTIASSFVTKHKACEVIIIVSTTPKDYPCRRKRLVQELSRTYCIKQSSLHLHDDVFQVTNQKHQSFHCSDPRIFWHPHNFQEWYVS